MASANAKSANAKSTNTKSANPPSDDERAKINGILDKQFAYTTEKVRRQLNLARVETGNPQLNAYLRDWRQFPRGKVSHIYRLIHPIQKTKKLMSMSGEYLCSVFKMERNGTTAIYAILYSLFEKGEIVHKFICTGPTFSSHDGEYRHRLLPFDVLQERMELPEISEKTEIAQKYILNEIKHGLYTPFVDYFLNPNLPNDAETKLKKSITDSRLCVDLFAMAWLVDFTRAKLNLTENHINPSYLAVVCDVGNVAATNTYNTLVDKFGIINLYKVYQQASRVKTPGVPTRPPEVGQKFVPMRYQETIDFGNIQYELWREWYLMRKCANLMLNFISPTFPYVYGWFLLRGVDARLFDNQSMYDKFVQSEVADQINVSLREGDNYTTKDGFYINNKFRNLSNKIREAGKYGDMTLRLSPSAFCMLQEHTHVTLGDVHLNRMYLPAPSKWLRDFFEDIDIFKKQMFEFIYGFYCLNTRLNIVHGDLHLNNATMFPVLSYYENMTDPSNLNKTVDNTYIMYVVHNDVFLFPQTGITSVIIDLSRATFGDRDALVEEFDEVFADTLLEQQRKQILRILERNYPSMMEKHGDAVRKLIIDNFPLFFRIFSAVDMLSLSRRLLSLYETTKIPMDKKNITAFLKEIEIESEKLFLMKLEDATEKRMTKIEDMPWPNYTLMHKLFPKNALCKRQVLTPAGKAFIADNSKYNVMDVFNQNAKLKYSVETLQSHPPYLNLSAEQKFIVESDLKVAKQVGEDVKAMISNDRADRDTGLEELAAELAANTLKPPMM